MHRKNYVTKILVAFFVFTCMLFMTLHWSFDYKTWNNAKPFYSIVGLNDSVKTVSGYTDPLNTDRRNDIRKVDNDLEFREQKRKETSEMVMKASSPAGT